MEKKNPFVTTVGFKKDDSDHVYVAELLNSMGRGKAQYIVKAVMLYQDMKESGELQRAVCFSTQYEHIRNVVLQVIEERERQQLQVNEKQIKVNMLKEKNRKEEDVFMELDDSALSSIRASLLTFQQQ